jgi:hypothetical protein
MLIVEFCRSRVNNLSSHFFDSIKSQMWILVRSTSISEYFFQVYSSTSWHYTQDIQAERYNIQPGQVHTRNPRNCCAHFIYGMLKSIEPM